jgi:hypothetical protein
MSAHEKGKSNFDLLINRASDVFQTLSHPLRLSICFELSTAAPLLAATNVPQVSVAGEACRFSTVVKPLADQWRRHDKG